MNAKEIVDEMAKRFADSMLPFVAQFKSIVVNAILEEREACAKAAEVAYSRGLSSEDAAILIRARGK